MSTGTGVRQDEINSLVRQINNFLLLSDQAFDWLAREEGREFSPSTYGQLIYSLRYILQHPALGEGELREEIRLVASALRSGQTGQLSWGNFVGEFKSSIARLRQALGRGVLKGWVADGYIEFVPRLDFGPVPGRFRASTHLADGALYISDPVPPEVARELIEALRQVAKAVGQEVIAIGPPLRGSWFQRFWVHVLGVSSSDETQRATRRLAQGLEDALVNEKAAAIDKARSETTLNLMRAAEGVNNFAAVLGDVLLIKITDSLDRSHVHIKTLTANERHVLERNDWTALRDPEALLMNLSSVAQTATSEVPSRVDGAPPA